MKISSKEYQKFSKQIILKKIGVIGQQKLKSAKVLVLGMGGLGCPLSIYLASLGIGTIGIVDNDKVELSNLNRQIIYSVNDILMWSFFELLFYYFFNDFNLMQ